MSLILGLMGKFEEIKSAGQQIQNKYFKMLYEYFPPKYIHPMLKLWSSHLKCIFENLFWGYPDSYNNFILKGRMCALCTEQYNRQCQRCPPCSIYMCESAADLPRDSNHRNQDHYTLGIRSTCVHLIHLVSVKWKFQMKMLIVHNYF